MKVFEWLAELRYRNGLLYRIGMMHFILAVMLLIPLMIDQRQVLGVNTWVKPLKFCISICIYAWTMGWLMFDIPRSKRILQFCSTMIGVTMLIEIVIMLYQAARAVPSHFNVSTSLDGMLFGIMGMLIAVNTVMILIVFVLYLIRRPALDAAYLMSVRLGFVIFLVGNWIGGQMIKIGAHSVGVEDGGPGVPFTNWSTVGGDLRIGHFLGLHAIQLIPLFSYFLLRRTSLSLVHRRMLTIVFAAFYGFVVSALYLQASRGESLF